MFKKIMKVFENKRRLAFIILPIITQIAITKITELKFPYVLIGAYFPLIFDYKDKKSKNYTIVLAMNILLRVLAIVVGLTFILIGRHYGIYNIKIGLIFVILSITSGFRIPYTATGIMFINTITYFVMDEKYPYFATGFLLFIVIEFIFNNKLRLIPFSNRTFSFSVKMDSKKAFGMGVVTCALCFALITGMYILQPFSSSYALERQKYQEKMQIQEEKDKEKMLKLIEQIEETNEK